jgi:hypothetical protein
MTVAGMMRLAEIDESKLGLELMKLSISKMAEVSAKLYFLQIGNSCQQILDHIDGLDKPYLIRPASQDFGSGWGFKNNESLTELYSLIDEPFDWVIYPDADDLLPENLLDILGQADELGAEVIRFHFIECLGSPTSIIEIRPGFPIGPHFKAVKPAADVTFIGSDGFNEATSASRKLKRYETQYCMRHLRYANPVGIEKRKQMNYFQDYFLMDHATIEYSPSQKIEYYTR